MQKTSFVLWMFGVIGVSAAQGCLIVDNTGDGGKGGQTSTTSVGGSTGGQGGVTGGSGGVTGGGGQGGGGQGGSVGGQGGSGGQGGAQCYDPDSAIEPPVGICCALNVAPKDLCGQLGPMCGPNMDELPPGYDVCTTGTAIFTWGAFGYLFDCLSKIDVADTCNPDLVQQCGVDMYANACDTAVADSTCVQIEAQCTGVGQSFDKATCKTELNVLNEANILVVVDCMNQADPGLDCQTAFDGCFNQLVTF